MTLDASAGRGVSAGAAEEAIAAGGRGRWRWIVDGDFPNSRILWYL